MMPSLIDLIPKDTSRKFQYLDPDWRPTPPGPRTAVPSADRRVLFGPRWFCIPEHELAEPDRLRLQSKYPGVQRFGAYCGAPPGIRCRCGAQLAGHDPGDEDPRT